MLSLGTLYVISLGVPPNVVGHIGNRLLEIPRSVVLKVHNGSIPAPGGSDPPDIQTLTVGCIFVIIVTPHVIGRSSIGTDGQAINLSVAKTISR